MSKTRNHEFCLFMKSRYASARNMYIRCAYKHAWKFQQERPAFKWNKHIPKNMYLSTRPRCPYRLIIHTGAIMTRTVGVAWLILVCAPETVLKRCDTDGVSKHRRQSDVPLIWTTPVVAADTGLELITHVHVHVHVHLHVRSKIMTF